MSSDLFMEVRCDWCGRFRACERARAGAGKEGPGTLWICANCADKATARVTIEWALEAESLLTQFRNIANEAQGHYGIEECAGPGQPATEWDMVQDRLAQLAREATNLLKRERS